MVIKSSSRLEQYLYSNLLKLSFPLGSAIYKSIEKILSIIFNSTGNILYGTVYISYSIVRGTISIIGMMKMIQFRGSRGQSGNTTRGVINMLGMTNLMRFSRLFSSAPAPPKPGSVYVVYSYGNYYKIGMTTRDVSKRLKEFKTASPLPPKLIFNIKSDAPRKLESILHKKYRDKRVRSDGEWFELTPRDLAEIKSSYCIE